MMPEQTPGSRQGSVAQERRRGQRGFVTFARLDDTQLDYYWPPDNAQPLFYVKRPLTLEGLSPAHLRWLGEQIDAALESLS